MKKNVRDFTKGNPVKELLLFSWPIALTLILQNLYNLADVMIIGRFVGDTAMGAVGSAGAVSGVLLMVVSGMTTGVSVVLSQHLGAKDYERVKKCLTSSIYIIVFVAVILTITGIAASGWILEMMHVEGEVLTMAKDYLTIIFAGTIATAFYNAGNSVSRAMGDSVTPMIVLIVTAVINITLNILFVAQFHMGTRGVAYATVIATIISAMVCWVILWHKFTIIHPDRKSLSPDGKAVRQIIKIGVPATLQSSTMTIGALVLQTFVNSFTTAALPVMAAYAAATKIEQMVSYPPGGVSDGMQVFAGQNVGAKKFDRVGKGLSACMKIMLLYSIFAVLVLVFGGGALMGLFTYTETTVNVGQQYLTATAAGIFFCGVDYTLRYTLTGVGDVAASASLSFFELFLRIGAAYVLAYYTPLGYVGIFWATPIAWTVTTVLGVIRYKSGKWKLKSLTGGQVHRDIEGE